MSTFKKGFEVIPAKPGAEKKTYRVAGKDMRFNGHNMFTVNDASVAKDIEQLYGGRKNSVSDELRVIPVGDMRSENGHTYSFSMSGLGNWKERINWS